MNADKRWKLFKKRLTIDLNFYKSSLKGCSLDCVSYEAAKVMAYETILNEMTRMEAEK